MYNVCATQSSNAHTLWNHGESGVEVNCLLLLFILMFFRRVRTLLTLTLTWGLAKPLFCCVSCEGVRSKATAELKRMEWLKEFLALAETNWLDTLFFSTCDCWTNLNISLGISITIARIYQ